jgi:Lon protease-like protein
MSDDGWHGFDFAVPLIPLPNLVMFPRAVQFLHIFEPRYKTMMTDLLAQDDGRRFLATALLTSNYEAKYYTNHADIHEIVCLTEIVNYERQPDGCFNLFVLGKDRARVRSEDRSGPYRQAELDVLENTVPIDEPTTNDQQRATLAEMLRRSPYDTHAEAERCLEWINSDLPFGDVLDLLSFYLLPHEEVELRQNLLGEPHAHRRADLLVGHLSTLGQVIEVRQRRHQSWPPDPGVN